jgi:anti-sigma regulatory factor (Ser/Thr protein kinase)
MKFLPYFLSDELYNPYSISNALVQLSKDNILVKKGEKKGTSYSLNPTKNTGEISYTKTFHSKDLEEHKVVEFFRKKLLFNQKVSEHISSIYEYALSEMVNNAIDHSQSKLIKVSSKIDNSHIFFIVEDFGIGVFRNLMFIKDLSNPFESMIELQKGRSTTLPELHSGEGIFFTSKIADSFSIKSYGYEYKVEEGKISQEKLRKELPSGSIIYFTLSLETNKHLNDIFERFETDPEDTSFDKTELQVRPIHQVDIKNSQGSVLVSRSQAKRIIRGLEKFNVVSFNFKDVPSIGQAFADEIFRVFQKQHPHIELQVEGANESVMFMIKRAIQRNKSQM